jgi:hypothetical protein
VVVHNIKIGVKVGPAMEVQTTHIQAAVWPCPALPCPSHLYSLQNPQSTPHTLRGPASMTTDGCAFSLLIKDWMPVWNPLANTYGRQARVAVVFPVPLLPAPG